MRVRVLVLYIIVVAVSVAINGVECSLSLSESNFSTHTYKTFIKNLREELRVGAYYGSAGIPILKHSVPICERFLLVDLINRNDETITLAINVEDAAFAAYRAADRSYFFQNAPQLAVHVLFTDTQQNIMDFNNTFDSIEQAGGITRSETPLGSMRFSSSISHLFLHAKNDVPASFLVLIQMVLEAAKFKFIEQMAVHSIMDMEDFTPGLAMLSLEDNWSKLSLQLQASESLNGVFGDSVLLYNSADEPIEVDSMYYPIVTANMALQLYQCPNGAIRMMPSPTQNQDYYNQQCSPEQRTTRISGRDGLCVDVYGGFSADGTRVILYPCGQQRNQKWTFYPDDTIRSMGKCLATNTSSVGSSVVITNCDDPHHRDGWTVSSFGTMMNKSSHLVVTANSAKSRTTLTGEENTFAAKQAWRIGNYVGPIITTIIGLENMCLEATDEDTNVWLESCVKNKTEQYWALYSDGTIRVNKNRNLCVSSSTDSSSEVIAIGRCDGSINQRWVFTPKGTILNPGYERVMDVAQTDVYLKKIILASASDTANAQQWVVFY